MKYSLKKGDTIAVFSPSAPITATAPIRFERAKAFLSQKGFKIKEGSLMGKKDFYRSGSIQERVEEFNALLRDPEVRCIMASIGGTNSNSLLPYIDYEAFKKDPKIIVGYSDVTAILMGLYAKTGISTFYGPAMVASFGELEPYVSWTYESFIQRVNHQNSPSIVTNPEFWTEEYIPWETQDRSKTQNNNELITVYPGKVKGRLIVGNLNTMQGIWGSEYMPKIKDGDILLIEDSYKNAATIERSFSLLKVNGVFNRISGLILGKHEGFDDDQTGRKPYEILLEVLNGQELPFLAEYDCAHTHPMITLPIGAYVELDATNQVLKVLSY